MAGKLGQWIANGTASPFYTRKVFTVDGPVRKAVAEVCGLGQFHFYMNGRKMGDHELDPGWTNYRKVIQYVTFDVTEYLRQGKNAVGAEVGNGWFIKTDEHYTFAFPAFMPPNPNPYRPFGRQLVLTVRLRIEYADGRETVLTADESWKVKRHPVVMSNVYGSETIDGRLVQPGWAEPGFDDDGWEPATVVPEEEAPAGQLTKQLQPSVRVIRSYAARPVRRLKKPGMPAREIYDFTQNMSGILEMEVSGQAGDQIRIYPAEKLGEDGNVDQVAKNWVTVDSCITFILAGVGREVFRMKFTYFAGRYVAIEKVGADGGNGIQIHRFTADAITSAWKTDGSFRCGDSRYEQIYSLVERAVEANMVSVHTDCPTIERFAWQEPNHLMAPSILFMKDGKKLWEKFLADMRADQHTAEDWFLDADGGRFYPGEGLVPAQAPCYIHNVLPVPGMGSFYDIIPWGSSCILGADWHYTFYGDPQIIRDNYGAGKKYLKYLKTKVTADGFINHGLGDWGNPKGSFLRENIETAFLYADVVTLAKFAAVLGLPEEEKELRRFAETVRDNYNEKLLVRHPETGKWCYRAWDHPDGVFLTQASQALPLYWGMVPADKEADVVDAFRETLLGKGAFSSGEVGLPYIIQTARKYGMNELIARFILREEHPSYYAFVLEGETTLGEYWESNPRSHCHDMMGSIIHWYYNGIAGIQPLQPGFAELSVCPFLPKNMGYFDCAYQSVHGKIRVWAEEQPDAIILQVTVPKGVRCSLDLKNLEERGKKIISNLESV